MLELVVSNPRPSVTFRIPPPPIPPRYEVIPATFAHLRAMEADMRAADRCEIAGLGVGVKKALWRGFRNSPICRVALIDGNVAAIWGVCIGMQVGSLLGSQGMPWLHTTADVEKIPLSFVKVAKTELAAMIALYPRLESYVAAEYVQAIKFLRILGFAVDEPAAVGVNGARYSRFHLGCV